MADGKEVKVQIISDDGTGASAAAEHQTRRPSTLPSSSSGDPERIITMTRNDDNDVSDDNAGDRQLSKTEEAKFIEEKVDNQLNRTRPSESSGPHNDENRESKRPRYETYRQTKLPFQPIARSKSDSSAAPSTSTSKSAEKKAVLSYAGAVKKDVKEKDSEGKGKKDWLPRKSLSDGERDKGPRKSANSGSERPSTSSSGYRRKDNRGRNPSYSGGGRGGGGYSAIKERLKEIAASTLEAIDNGAYECTDGDTVTIYELREKVDWMIENTAYYPPNSELAGWAGAEGISGTGDAPKAEEVSAESQLSEDAMDVDPPSTDPPVDTVADDNPTPAPATNVPMTLYQTEITLAQCSTLEGSRWLHSILAGVAGQKSDKKIGVLNFASATKPGGGFINGARAQEESIARSSTLYASLMINVAQQFYTLHNEDRRGGWYTHAMIYSPRVQLIKNDDGEWVGPIEVDIVTSPAVNAGVVRRGAGKRRRGSDEEDTSDVAGKGKGKGRKRRNDDGEEDGKGKGKGKSKWEWKGKANKSKWTWKDKNRADPKDTDDRTTDSDTDTEFSKAKADLETKITAEMHERMARILYLYQLQGTRNLVLGSFGTGVFQNTVEAIGQLWIDLLVGDNARFRGVFERVIFAILDEKTVGRFEEVFGKYGIGVSELEGFGKAAKGASRGKDSEKREDGSGKEKEAERVMKGEEILWGDQWKSKGTGRVLGGVAPKGEDTEKEEEHVDVITGDKETAKEQEQALGEPGATKKPDILSKASVDVSMENVTQL